jgi:flagellar hook-associated protein 3 FlgL
MTRVSERSRFEGTQNRIDAVKEFNDRVQKTAVSGRKLHRLSDDPAGAIRVFRNRTKLENVAQFKKSVDFADGFLSKSEDSLRSLNDILIRSRELAVQLSNSTYSADDRIAASEEVRQLLGQVSSIGNSTYGDKFIFGGFRTSSPPISPDGTYCGDDGQIVVQFDENTFRAVNISGRAVFDVEPENEAKEVPLAKAVEHLYHGLTNDNLDQVREAIAFLDKSITRVVNHTATLGARRASFVDLQTRLAKSEEDLLVDNNNIEGADPVQMALDLKRADNTLQFTLQSTAKMIQPTLLTYMGGG